MRQRIVIVVGVAVMLAVAALRSTRSAAVADSNRKDAAYFSNVELITQDGVKVRFYDDLLKGKIVVIELFYTHCQDSCPLETARLAQVQRMLGDRVGRDIFFYSISIDPSRDTPAQLKAYAEKYRVGPGWLFLTGDPQDIDLVSKRLGLYTEPVDRDGHTPAVLLGNEPAGQWIRNAATDNPRRLAVVIGDWLNGWQSAKKGTSFAEVPRLSLDNKGQYLFATHCAACHSIGHGDRIGPDLKGVTALRDAAWVKRFIATPDKVLAERDPLATALFAKYDQVIMPNLRLADADVNTLFEFLAKTK